MSIFNQHTLSFCESGFAPQPAIELLSKAVCRLPLGIARGYLFPKPPMPSFRVASTSFERPLPPR